MFEPKRDGLLARGRVRRAQGGSSREPERQHVQVVPALTAALAAALPVRNAILAGEIVLLGPDGAPQFYQLRRRRTPQDFMAFDLLWLNDRDLRGVSLLERKRLLRQIVPPQPSPVLYVDHVAGSGLALFDAVYAPRPRGQRREARTGSIRPRRLRGARSRMPRTRRRRGGTTFSIERGRKTARGQFPFNQPRR